MTQGIQKTDSTLFKIIYQQREIENKSEHEKILSNSFVPKSKHNEYEESIVCTV